MDEAATIEISPRVAARGGLMAQSIRQIRAGLAAGQTWSIVIPNEEAKARYPDDIREHPNALFHIPPEPPPFKPLEWTHWRDLPDLYSKPEPLALLSRSHLPPTQRSAPIRMHWQTHPARLTIERAGSAESVRP